MACVNCMSHGVSSLPQTPSQTVWWCTATGHKRFCGTNVSKTIWHLVVSCALALPPSLSLSQVPQQGEGDSRRQLHILVQLGTSRWAGGGQERAPGISCWGNTPHGYKRCSYRCTMSWHLSLPLPLPLRSMVVTYHNGRDSFSTPGRPSPHQASQTEPPLNQLCLSILNLTFSYQFSLKYF